MKTPRLTYSKCNTQLTKPNEKYFRVTRRLIICSYCKSKKVIYSFNVLDHIADDQMYFRLRCATCGSSMRYTFIQTYDFSYYIKEELKKLKKEKEQSGDK